MYVVVVVATETMPHTVLIATDRMAAALDALDVACRLCPEIIASLHVYDSENPLGVVVLRVAVGKWWFSGRKTGERAA